MSHCDPTLKKIRHLEVDGGGLVGREASRQEAQRRSGVQVALELTSGVAVDARLRHRAHLLFEQAEDGIRGDKVTGVQTCALPIYVFYSQWLSCHPPFCAPPPLPRLLAAS